MAKIYQFPDKKKPKKKKIVNQEAILRLNLEIYECGAVSYNIIRDKNANQKLLKLAHSLEQIMVSISYLKLMD